MPYQTIVSEGLEVESEHTRTTLRVIHNGERLFSCEVTATSPLNARITNGAGIFNKKIRRVIENWLRLQSYTSYTYERADKNVRTFHLDKS